MRPESKGCLKFLLYSGLVIIIGIVGFYVYIGYQFGYSIENLLFSIKENVELKRKRQVDALIYGDNIEEISQEEYEKFKRYHLINLKIQPSKIQKIDNQIQVNLNVRALVFKDEFDDECMACLVEHEVVGELPTLNKLIIETSYFRSRICQLIDMNHGKIDTLSWTPAITPNDKLAVTENSISKDTLTMGLNLYSIDEESFKIIRQIGQNWIPKEYFWRGNDEIFAKVNLVIEDQVYWGDDKYVRIKNIDTKANND